MINFGRSGYDKTGVKKPEPKPENPPPEGENEGEK